MLRTWKLLWKHNLHLFPPKTPKPLLSAVSKLVLPSPKPKPLLLHKKYPFQPNKYIIKDNNINNNLSTTVTTTKDSTMVNMVNMVNSKISVVTTTAREVATTTTTTSVTTTMDGKEIVATRTRTTPATIKTVDR